MSGAGPTASGGARGGSRGSTAISSALLHFVELFNAGEYWESHEVLEGPWRETRSPLLHGLILLASAWVHVDRGNLHGVRAQHRKAIRALESWRDDGRPGPPLIGTELIGTELIGRCERWLAEAERTEDPEALAQWPRPRLELKPPGHGAEP